MPDNRFCPEQFSYWLNQVLSEEGIVSSGIEVFADLAGEIWFKGKLGAAALRGTENLILKAAPIHARSQET